MDQHRAVALEEYKLLQQIIARHSDNEFKIRGWLLTLITALAVAFFSEGTLELSPGHFATMVAMVAVLFLFMELLQRIAKRKAIKRVLWLEARLSVGKDIEREYCGPKIAEWLTGDPAAFSVMIREVRIPEVGGFYLLVIVVVMVTLFVASF